MFVVAVRFELFPEGAEAFKNAVLPNAAASEGTEPGCRQFDACFNEDGLFCFLYEVYDDEAAFEAHRNSAHFLKFKEAIEGTVKDRRFESYDLPVNPHKN